MKIFRGIAYIKMKRKHFPDKKSFHLYFKRKLNIEPFAEEVLLLFAREDLN
jgi:hypothetical protein